METLYATPTTKYVEILPITRSTSLDTVTEFLADSTARAIVGYSGTLYLSDKGEEFQCLIVEYGDYLVKVFGDVEIFSADEFAKHFEIV